MLVLSCRKMRNRLTGSFSFLVRNAVKFRTSRKEYVLKIPQAIMRVVKWHIGNRVAVSAEHGALVLRRSFAKDGVTVRSGKARLSSRGAWNKCGRGIRVYAAKAP